MKKLLYLLFLQIISLNNVEGTKKCCKNGYYDANQRKCEQGPNDKNVLQLHYKGIDGNNQNVSTTGYNFPRCLENLELGMAENILDFHPEFVLQASQLMILEDRSSHLDFCIDETGDDDLTVALYCRKKLDLKCEENDCTRRCCHMGEVRTTYAGITISNQVTIY